MPLVVSFFMALIMSCVMSLVISVFNVGLIDGIIWIWLKAWAFAFVAAFPTIMIVAPIARRLAGMLVGNSS